MITGGKVPARTAAPHLQIEPHVSWGHTPRQSGDSSVRGRSFFGWPASLAGSPESIRGGPPFGEGLTDPPPLSPHMDIYVLASAKNDAVPDVPEKPTARNLGAHSAASPPPPGAMSQLFDPASPGQGLTPTGPPQASRRQTARSLRAIPEAAPSSSHCLALELPRPTARAHAHRYERSTNSSPATCYPASLERRIPNLGATLRRQISLSPTTAGKHLPRTFFSV